MAAEPVASAPAPAPPAPPVVSTPPKDRSEQKPPPCPKLGWVDVCSPPDPQSGATPLSGAERDAWWARRGAKAPKAFQNAGCEIVHVGPDKEEALGCARVRNPSKGGVSATDQVFRVAVDWVVLAARAKRATTLVSIPYVIDVLDKETGGGGPLFAMGVVMDPGGERIAVMEPGENACAKARAQLSDQKKQAAADPDADARHVMTAWARFDASLLEGICRQPRVWIWKGGRFRPPSGGVVSSGTRVTSGVTSGIE
jgi:hypothetical protein